MYPHSFTKGQFKEDGTLDFKKDGKCSTMDSAAQWMDCGIPCPVGDEARASGEKGELNGFGAAVIVFMCLCTIIGALAFIKVKGELEKFFVAGRNLPLAVITATLASQSLDSNAALGNIDLGYKLCLIPTLT